MVVPVVSVITDTVFNSDSLLKPTWWVLPQPSDGLLHGMLQSCDCAGLAFDCSPLGWPSLRLLLVNLSHVASL